MPRPSSSARLETALRVCPSLGVPLMVRLPVGASLLLATVMAKVSLAERLPSEVVTVTLTVPTSPLRGVPETVRVAALKLSQLGRALPLARVAV